MNAEILTDVPRFNPGSYNQSESPSGLLIVEAASEPEESIDDYFPAVDCGQAPLGGRIVVQLRGVKRKSSGGIILPEDTKETEKWNTQVAKVISIGPLAFRNRETKELWPEGMWVSIGDFVRVPRWGGDRWEIEVGESKSSFAVFNDYELITKVTGDPLKIKAFIL